MNNLPTELLPNIFVWIHQRDKVECMTVCRQWANIIENSCLFHTIYINRRNQVDEVIKKARLAPLQVAKVERLVIMINNDRNISRDTLNNLLVLLPNVRTYFYRAGFSNEHDQTINQSTQLHSWNNTIERIVECDDNLVTHQILASGVCPFLTKIFMAVCGYVDGSVTINLLANAPSLTELNMEGFFFTLADLELLHNNVPLLTSLSLVASMISRGASFPTVSTPASTVTKLDFYAVELPEPSDELALFRYIGQKYTSVSKLECLTNVASLTEYDSEKVYYDGFISLARKMGSNLSGIIMTMEEQFIDSIFELDAAGCQIKSFCLDLFEKYSTIEKLMQSKQTNYIQSLSIGSHQGGHSLEWLKSFKMLKDLNTNFISHDQGVEGNTFDLNELLSNTNDGLEKLHLRYDDIKFDLSNIPHCPSLKTLEISYSPLSPDLDCFISQAFPKLEHLRIFRCEWSLKRFSLPNMDLSSLEISHKFLNIDDKVLVTTSKERRWTSLQSLVFYNVIRTEFDYSDASVFPSVSSCPFGEFEGEPCIELELHSVRSCYLSRLS